MNRNSIFIERYAQRAGVSIEEAKDVADDLCWLFAEGDVSLVDLDAYVDEDLANNLQRQLDALDSEKSVVESTLDEVSAERDELRSRLEEANAQLESQAKQLREAEAEFQKITARYEGL